MQTVHIRNKFLLAIAFIGFSVAVLISQQLYYPAIIGYSALLLFIAIYIRSNVKYRLGFIIAFLALFRIYVYLSTPSMIGMDPDKVAVAVERIVIIGETNAISDLSFYHIAAAFHVLGATAAMIFDAGGRNGLLIVPIIVTVIPALTAMSIAQRFGFEGFFAGALTSIASPLAAWSVQPIPQALASSLIPIVIVYAVILLQSESKVSRIPIYIVISCLIVAHKLPMAYLFVVLAVATVITRQKTIILLTSAVAVVTVLQYFYLTDFLWGLTNVVLLPLVTDAGISTGEVPSIIAAEPILGGFIGGIIKNLYWLTFGLLAGAGWLLFANYQRSKHNVAGRFLIACAIGSGVFLVLGVFGPELAYTRVLFMVLIAFSVMLEPLFNRLSSRSTATIAIILIFLQLTAPIATPDNPLQYREYLTEEEIHSKERISSMSNTVQSDNFYVKELSDINPSRTYQTGGEVAEQAGWTDLGTVLFNNQFETVSDPIVMRDIPRYRFIGTWVLTYDADSTLNQSRNRVFDSGNVTLHV